jgi:group II intron reverse transcriptase/maturase
LVGAFPDEEGPVTALGLSARAQRTLRKVQVLQRKLYQAAKKDRNRTFGILYDKVCWWEVLWESWIRVQRNKGAPGVDGRTILAIKREGEVKFLREIQEELRAKRYRPQPIQRVYIRKKNGKLRPLGIPVVKDRVIQGAVKLVLEPIFEANFEEESYGFRPQRSCQKALRSIRKWVTYGYSTVIDADIASYFDTIDHELLMLLVERRIRDKWVLRLIRRWLKCSIFEEDRVFLSDKGTPQGGVLSPLLANIYLHPLDKYWATSFRAWDTKLVRYCDDFVILIRNQSPEPYMRRLQAFLDRLRLTLSEEKTRILDARDGFDFLGVRFILRPTRRDPNRHFCYGFPTPKAMKGVRSKIRRQIGRNYQRSLDEQIQRVNPVIRGWANYYNWLNSGEHFHKTERYVLQRLNGWLRRKQRKGRFRKPSARHYFEAGLYRLSGTIQHVC